MQLFTIGHSNHSIDKFLQLLENNHISELVDVRSMPFSKYNPQFNKEELEFSLHKHSIKYMFLGKYLGGRPKDPTCYRGGILPGDDADFLHEVNYSEVMKRTWFIQGISHLLKIADEEITTILCSEEDPAQCHRHHLIAKYLMDEYPEIDVRHICGDGNIYGASAITTTLIKPEAEQLSFF